MSIDQGLPYPPPFAPPGLSARLPEEPFMQLILTPVPGR